MLINLRNALMTGKRLPYDAEVEYLESTGTQWIDTGVVASQNIKIEARFYRANSPSQFAYGVRSGSTTISCATGVGTSVATVGYARWGNSAYAAAIPNTEVVVVQDKDGVTVNGVHYNYTAAESVVPQSGYTIALFAAKNSATTVAANLSGKFWYCKIWQNGVLVRDYIPVRKGNVGYLYDRVSGKLFGNAGTGDFVLGSDVVPVEWLEGDGNSYIDLGIKPSNQYLEIEAEQRNSGTANVGLISAGNSSPRLEFYNWGPRLEAWIGTYGTQSVFATTIGSRISIKATGRNLTFKNISSGAKVSATYTFTGQTQQTAALFCIHRESSSYAYIGKWKLFKAYVDSLKCLPVRVGSGSTWEGALLDTVTRRIYRNAGTGAFTYGNDLPYPIPA